MHHDGGVKTFYEYMDSLFKINLAEHYDDSARFNSVKRKNHGMIDLVNEFEKLYNIVKKRGRQISQILLVFNLSDATMLRPDKIN